MISVLDLGVGNVLAVMRMVQRAGGRAHLAMNADDLTSESVVVVPGVGAFDAGAAALKSRGFDEALRQIASGGEGRILGLCLGMQLLFDGSDEGSSPGLGIVPGVCKKLPSNSGVRVPHMGWNSVRVVEFSSTMEQLPDDPRFYFAHSFYVEPSSLSGVTLTANHGVQICAAFERPNVVGAQFHPEKSHRFGLSFMRGFVGA